MLLLAIGALFGCSSDAIDADADAEPSEPEPVELQPVALQEVFRAEASVPLSATALAWNAAVSGELWVTLRQFPSGKPCTNAVKTGCSALQGVAAVVADATSDAPEAVLKEDGNSWHFMRMPTAIAWGEGELFASCGEARTDNFEDDEVPYAGPVLWSSSPEIFGVEPLPSQNGTHLDMLHATPWCMGIAHEAKNAYWAVNGDASSLDRYDFHMPHQIGGEDHQDGEVHRYAKGEFSRVEGVPSHAAYDAATGLVYLADTGNSRVLVMDPSTATPGGPIATYEPLHASGEMVGATVEDFVPEGSLEQPSGLVLHDGELIVTDHATSQVHVYSLASRKLVASYDTELPSGSLAGVSVGPDDKIYLTDMQRGCVYRFER